MASIAQWRRRKRAERRELHETLRTEELLYQLHGADGGIGSLGTGPLETARQDLLLKGIGWTHAPELADGVGSLKDAEHKAKRLALHPSAAFTIIQ
jgi:hypothetical protein